MLDRNYLYEKYEKYKKMLCAYYLIIGKVNRRCTKINHYSISIVLDQF